MIGTTAGIISIIWPDNQVNVNHCKMSRVKAGEQITIVGSFGEKRALSCKVLQNEIGVLRNINPSLPIIGIADVIHSAAGYSYANLAATKEREAIYLWLKNAFGELKIAAKRIRVLIA